MLEAGHFLSLGKNKADLIAIVNQVNPEILHWEEIPELFCDPELAAQIYLRPERPTIVETTHSSEFNVGRKVFLPDSFMFCSEFSRRQYAALGIPADVVEYPVEAKERPVRWAALAQLGLNPNETHVLNVGLFTPGKNQGEAFDLAMAFVPWDSGLARNVKFHFVGNRAPNFKDYWASLQQPPNCVLWGERSDVDAFYSACDLFLFTSLNELNPLVVKEALGWQMPVLMRDLPTYCGSYKAGDQIAFLTSDRAANVRLINERLMR
jgi:glycosyltransferase involved in cell wall biosynthesis